MPDKETLERAREDAREGKGESLPAPRLENSFARRCTTSARENTEPLHEAGHRDWPVKGAAVGRKAGTTQRFGFDKHQEASGSRLP